MFATEENIFHLAAYCGDAEKVKKYLKQGININSSNEKGNTALLLAIDKDRYEMIKLLCEQGADVNQRNHAQESALTKAIFNAQNKALVAYLIAKGCTFDDKIFTLAWFGDKETLSKNNLNLHKKDKCGHSILHYAAAAGHLELVKWLLLEQKFNVGEKNNIGDTALHFAAWNGHLDLVQWLHTEGGANFADKNDHGTSVLDLACINGNHEVMKWLIKENKISGSSWEKTRQLNNALLIAAREGHAKIVMWLLNEGLAEVSAKNIEGMTALLETVRSGNFELFQWLLEKGGATLSEKCNLNGSALLYAAFYGYSDIVKWILRKDPTRITEKNIYGMNVLHMAARNGQLDLIKWFIDVEKLNIDAKDYHGYSPILIAADTGQLETIQWLKEAGANMGIEGGGELTVLNVACARGHTRLVQWLLDTDSAQLNAYACLYALRDKQYHIVELLLSQGVAINADLTDIDFRNCNLKNSIFIGAVIDSVPVKFENAINNNNELQQAINNNLPINCLALQKAVANQLRKYPEDKNLMQTQAILNAYYNRELIKTIGREEPCDWHTIRQKTNSKLTKDPENKELQNTKHIAESLSSLKNRCLFFCADHLQQMPQYKQTLPLDLVEEIERVRPGA